MIGRNGVEAGGRVFCQNINDANRDENRSGGGNGEDRAFERLRSGCSYFRIEELSSLRFHIRIRFRIFGLANDGKRK